MNKSTCIHQWNPPLQVNGMENRQEREKDASNINKNNENEDAHHDFMETKTKLTGISKNSYCFRPFEKS